MSYIDTSNSRTELFWYTAGRLIETCCKLLEDKQQEIPEEIFELIRDTLSLFGELNEERTDFVHSYPITNWEMAQILHRRKDSKGKYFEVTSEFLDSFIGRLDKVSLNLYKIRDAVRIDEEYNSKSHY